MQFETFFSGAGSSIWGIYLLVHLCVAILFSACEILLISDRFSKKGVYTLLFVINTTLPVLGIITTIFLTCYLINRQKKLKSIDFNRIYVYESVFEFPVIKRIFGEAFIMEALDNKDIPVELKLKALISLSALKIKKSIQVLRSTFSHYDDELRLYSYNIVNQLEKEINRGINKNIQNADKETDPVKKAKSYAELARLYWELVYLEIAGEALQNFYISESEKYANMAIEHLKDDYNLYILLGRINVIRRNYKAAYKSFMRALELKAPRIKVIPYLSEVFFIKKDYKSAGNLLLQDKELKNDQLLSPVVALWEGCK